MIYKHLFSIHLNRRLKDITYYLSGLCFGIKMSICSDDDHLNKIEADMLSPNEAFTTPVFVRGVGYYYCPGKKESPRSQGICQ